MGVKSDYNYDNLSEKSAHIKLHVSLTKLYISDLKKVAMFK